MSGLKVLVIGKGGREAALAWKLAQSKRVGKVFVAPGNAGTASYAENVPVQPTDIKGLVQWATAHDIYLTVVGPEDPLALGLVDAFQRRGLRVFGPRAGAARVEASKAFAKEAMQRAGVPTAPFRTFTDYDAALEYVRWHKAPIVVKADGPAQGKGVFVCLTLDEAEQALRLMMIDEVFGRAGKKVVVESRLSGSELSVHALCDGKTALLFPPSQDHKRIGVGDQGNNTGGMGAVAPLPGVPGITMGRIHDSTVVPVLRHMSSIGHPFAGCLYPGLMLTDDGPQVLEINGRFGDPETELYMLLLENDLLDLLDACVDGTLHEQKLRWRRGYAACVVLASGGYPDDYTTGMPVFTSPAAPISDTAQLFHAGTVQDGDRIVTAGGRVIMATACGDSLDDAVNNAYDLAGHVSFPGMYSRSDIGVHALAANRS